MRTGIIMTKKYVFPINFIGFAHFTAIFILDYTVLFFTHSFSLSLAPSLIVNVAVRLTEVSLFFMLAADACFTSRIYTRFFPMSFDIYGIYVLMHICVLLLLFDNSCLACMLFQQHRHSRSFRIFCAVFCFCCCYIQNNLNETVEKR